MIALLARLTGLSPTLARLVAAGALLAALAGLWGLHQWYASSALSDAREAGAVAERGLWSAKVDEERQRQAAINARATELAQHEAATLRAERDDLARTLEDLSHEADADADAARSALGAASVRRLDAIR